MRLEFPVQVVKRDSRLNLYVPIDWIYLDYLVHPPHVNYYAIFEDGGAG